MRRTTMLALLTASGVVASTSLADEPYFVGLGDLPGNAYYSRAFGVSAEGSVVVGSSLGSRCSNGYAPFLWTMSEGMLDLGDLPGGGCESLAYGVSADGTRIVGRGRGTYGEGWVWQDDTGLVGLGDLGGPPSSGGWISFAWRISSDGGVIVGEATSVASHNSCDNCLEACRWVWSDGVWIAEALGDLPGGDYAGAAKAVSRDGSVVVGSASVSGGSEAFLWTASSGMQGLEFLPGESTSRASACSADGSVVVGASGEGFRWTAQGGMVGLGNLPGGGFADPIAVSPDGSLVVGRDWGAGSNGAFIWDEMNGMRRLSEVLADEYGLDLNGWSLLIATAFSPDGLYIAGGGTNPDGAQEAWLVYLGTACDADLTGDGLVNTRDFIAFLNAWATGDPVADWNDDGSINTQDFIAYLNDWAAGC